MTETTTFPKRVLGINERLCPYDGKLYEQVPGYISGYGCPVCKGIGNFHLPVPKEKYWDYYTYNKAKLIPGYCFVDFKVDTPYYGCLLIDTFQRPHAACDEIQSTGKLQWEGNWYEIVKDRTADLRKLSEPHSAPLIQFITTQLKPIKSE